MVNKAIFLLSIVSMLGCIDMDRHKQDALPNFEKYTRIKNYKVMYSGFKENQSLIKADISESDKARLLRSYNFIRPDSLLANLHKRGKSFVDSDLFDIYDLDTNYRYVLVDGYGDYYAYHVIGVSQKQNHVVVFENFPEVHPSF